MTEDVVKGLEEKLATVAETAKEEEEKNSDSDSDSDDGNAIVAQNSAAGWQRRGFQNLTNQGTSPISAYPSLETQRSRTQVPKRSS